MVLSPDSTLYIGLISGTSVDGIDAALVDFSSSDATLLCSHLEPFEPELRQQILDQFTPEKEQLDQIGQLDVAIGHKLACAAENLIKKSGINPKQVRAIGSHGQTIRHRPHLQHPFTVQIGDPNIIAERLGINVVADFRRRDMAAGGQGAPLAPAFHRAFLANDLEDRIVLNLGGIANITYLPKGKGKPVAFDTGPANGLMDAWIHENHQLEYDQDGQWAATGRMNQELVQAWLRDPYFQLPAPKSTGKEHFHLTWLRQHAAVDKLPPEDVQASLLALSVESIHQAISAYCSNRCSVILCGGGVKNAQLVTALTQRLAGKHTVMSSAEFGIHPDWLEAMAFAWLAKCHLEQAALALTPFTGAKGTRILGGLYPG